MNNTIVTDLDGTLIKHQGYLEAMLSKPMEVLPGVLDKLQFWIRDNDLIFILSARPEEYRKATEKQLKEAGIPYHTLILGATNGARFLINDTKPKGYAGLEEDFITTYAIPLERDKGLKEIEL